jgi:hypothetical protein
MPADHLPADPRPIEAAPRPGDLRRADAQLAEGFDRHRMVEAVFTAMVRTGD